MGQDSELKLAGALLPDKQFELSEFQLKSAALDVGGTLALSADGLPSAFEILATINPGRTDVALPISGSELG